MEAKRLRGAGKGDAKESELGGSGLIILRTEVPDDPKLWALAENLAKAAAPDARRPCVPSTARPVRMP